MSYVIGERIGDYEIVSVLGAGGMGKVYKVRNLISERIEAMKVLLPNLESDPDLADRFMREIKVQASLQHPNIAALHTALRVNNQLLMLLEFVEGVTLEAEFRQTRVPVAKGIDYIKQVLSALSYAHARGVIHRDIKPANMMLTPAGVVKLMDFGIAKLSQDRKLTQTGRTVGSLYYMSPEQIQGAVDLDPRSDLYSLGVSLYEIVTNTRPFQGDSDYSIMAAHLGVDPVPPIQIDPTLPPMLNDVILMSIARDPAQRFQTADAFRKALETVERSLDAGAEVSSARTTAPVAATPALPVAAAPAQKSRRGLYMAMGSTVTVAVLAVAALQGPKFFGPSSASSPKAAVEQAPVSHELSTPATREPVAPALGMPATEQQSAAPAAAPPASRRVELPASAPKSPASSGPAVRVAQNTSPSPTNLAQAVPAQSVPAAVPSPGVPVPQPSASQAPAPAAANEEKLNALRELRESFAMLGTRANSLKVSLNTMKQQQARQGLNLRQDVQTSEQRMEYYLDEAEAALKAADGTRMKRSLDSAEREIERIEKFLGR